MSAQSKVNYPAAFSPIADEIHRTVNAFSSPVDQHELEGVALSNKTSEGCRITLRLLIELERPPNLWERRSWPQPAANGTGCG